jgi:hypothetical protein
VSGYPLRWKLRESIVTEDLGFLAIQARYANSIFDGDVWASDNNPSRNPGDGGGADFGAGAVMEENLVAF